MEINKRYNLDECNNRKKVINKLKSLRNDGKIEYDLENDILHIEDIDLEDSDIEELVILFEETDTFEYLDYNDDTDDLYRDEFDNENDNYWLLYFNI